MGIFNSDDHPIYCCGQASLRKNGVAITVNKSVRNAVLGGSLKNDRMISVHFQGKPFNMTAIQVYALNSNTEEAEVERFITNTPKRWPFHYRGLECKSKKSRNTWSNRQFDLGAQNEAGKRLREFGQENALVIANTLSSNNTREDSIHDITRWPTSKSY